MTTYAGLYGPEALIDGSGHPITSATIDVFTHGTTTHVSLYQDNARVTPLSNPVPNGVDGSTAGRGLDTYGNLSFYIDPGRYDLRIATGAGTRTVEIEIETDPAESTASGVTPATAGFDVILLAGQSNMSGGAGPSPDLTHLDPTDKDIWQYVNGGITLALDPLSHPDNTAFVGPGPSFARWWATANPGRRVLLVPRAYQGTGFASGDPQTWDPADANAASLYNTAISQANAAIAAAQAIAPSSKIVAFLWHQGENDAWSSWTQSQYATKLDALIAGFRAGVTGATASTPFILGRMVPDWIGSSGSLTSDQIDKAHADTPRRVAHTWVARGASGLNDGANIYHYSAPGQRLMGQRMFFALTNAAANTGSAGIVPDQPSDVTLAFTPGPGQIVLNWLPANSNSTVTGYEVWKGTATGAETLLTTLGNVLTYTDTAVVANTAYYYKLRAINATGTSAYSTERFITYRTTALIATDTFTRANSTPTNGASTLGNTETGAKTWTFRSGFQIYVDQSKALLVQTGSPGAACATITAGYGDVDVSANILSTLINNDKPGIVVRYTDESNYVTLYAYGTAQYKLTKVIAGVETLMANIAQTPATGDLLRLAVTNTTYTAYINGVLVATVTDAGPSTVAGNVGLRVQGSASSTGWFDNFTLYSPQTTSGAAVSDLFNRADSATTMGSADTGQAWAPQAGTWGISSNTAYCPTSPSQATTVVDSGLADCTIICTMVTAGDAGICWRSTDTNNHFLIAGNTSTAYRKQAGTFNSVGTFAALANGDVVKVVLSGSTHTIFVNGTQVLQFTDAFQATATKHGLRTNTSAARWDNFTVS